jgi:hypothetical protein
MNNQPLPPNVKIWQLGLGFANTIIMCALIKTGVTEELRDEPKSVMQLTSACNLNKDMLFRTLKYAKAIEIISENNGAFALTDTGRLLLKDVPGSIRGGLMLFVEEPWQKSWNNFPYTLQTGKTAFDDANGSPLFDFLQAHPENGLQFDQWMTTLSLMASKMIPEVYDFSGSKIVCDIGGGQGILLKGILTTNPHLTGILFDLESVVGNNVLGDIADKVRIIPGSFFESVPSADVMILKFIIHDWNDEKASLILDSCRKAMTPGTKLLIMERVLEGETDFLGQFYDLHMQVMVGGRERSEDEFRSLLEQSDLKLNRIIPTKSPLRIIEVTL